MSAAIGRSPPTISSGLPGAALKALGEELPDVFRRPPDPQIDGENPRLDHHRERDQHRRQHHQRGPGVADHVLMLDADAVAGRDDHRKSRHRRKRRRHEVLRPRAEQREQPHRHDRREREEINEHARARIDALAHHLRRLAARRNDIAAPEHDQDAEAEMARPAGQPASSPTCGGSASPAQDRSAWCRRRDRARSGRETG